MDNRPIQPLAYTVPALCAAAGIGRSRLYEDVAAGRLRTFKLGTRTLIRAEDARRWLDSYAGCAPPHGPKEAA